MYCFILIQHKFPGLSKKAPARLQTCIHQDRNRNISVVSFSGNHGDHVVILLAILPDKKIAAGLGTHSNSNERHFFILLAPPWKLATLLERELPCWASRSAGCAATKGAWLCCTSPRATRKRRVSSSWWSSSASGGTTGERGIQRIIFPLIFVPLSHPWSFPLE